jgi:hypothetical protein
VKTVHKQKATHNTAWIGVVEQLAKLSEGEGVEVPITSEQFSTANSAIRSGCYRRGFTAVFRRVPEKNAFRIYRKDGIAISRRLQENQPLVERFINGETLAAIGQSLGISRQAVDEKIKKILRFSEVPVHERIETTQQFIQPYLDVLGKRSCVLCKEPMQEAQKRHRGMCVNCSQVLKARTLAASRLRGYLREPSNRHQLAEALVLIRRYNFQPEDLVGM